MNTPKFYCKDKNNVKAFVLGCDPTAFDAQKNACKFEYVFDLNNDERYFSSILRNLNCIGLSKDNIYVQNLVTEAQKVETSENKNWKTIALDFIPDRKKEFDEVDISHTVPVFITAGVLYEVLVETKHTFQELYKDKTLVPILPQDNKLGRPLIPLFRHKNYSLCNDENKDYKERILNYLSSSKGL